MNTIEIVAAGDGGRRRRRKHSPQFKAAVVAACRKPGVSIASVALANRLNANLVRRWVDAEERSGLPARLAPAGKLKAVRPAGDEFVPITIETANAGRESITIELRKGATIVNVAWPVSAASECSDWLRTLLR